ncbi:STE like transcription factor-domain-containing protein [Umbelopsis sp. AD052]|nr:STE like transcription factor-domain-containing protein [Umbelopsis sp. AD052]
MEQNNVHQIDTSNTPIYKMPTPTDEDMQMRLAMIDDLKLFLATAPTNWNQDSPIKQFPLPTGEQLSCILWGKLFHITGTDIVRSLMFRFHAFGRPVSNLKKFEEGIFSDLRNLKPGTDACLEEPKSEFLDLLYKNRCIRTQKKQKVFYWYSVPHDRLFLDALERDLKREKMGIEPTSIAVAQPAKSISLDTTQELFDDLRKSLCLSSSDVYNDTFYPGGMCADPSIVQNSHPSSQQTGTTIQTWPTPVMLDMETTQTAQANDPHQDPTAWMTVSHSGDISSNEASQKAGMITSSAVISGSASSLARETHQFSPPPLVMPHSSQTRHRASQSVISVLSADESIDSFDDEGSTGSRNTLSPRTDVQPVMLSVASQNSMMFDRSSTIDPIASDFNRLQLASNSSLDASSIATSRSVDTNSLRKSATLFGMFSLFEGSPSYKQRRRRSTSISVPCQQNRPLSANDTLFTRAYSRPAYTHNRSCSQPNFGMVYNHPQDQGLSGQPMSMYGHPGSTSDMLQSANGDDAGSNPLTRSYICPMPSCARLFKRLEHLKRHLRTHTMERPYVCTICGKRFSRSDNLAQHKKTHERRRERGLNTTGTMDSKSGGEDEGSGHKKSASYSDTSCSEVSATSPERSQSGKRRRGILTHEGQTGCTLDAKTEQITRMDTDEYETIRSSNYPLYHGKQFKAV